MTGLAETGAALLGGVLQQTTALHGGNLSQIIRMSTGCSARPVGFAPNPAGGSIFFLDLPAAEAEICLVPGD